MVSSTLGFVLNRKVGKRKIKEYGRGIRERTHPFEVHALHRLVHATDDRRHVAGHRPHRHRRLNPACDGIYPARQSEEVQRFTLLPDRIRGVDASPVVVALLERLDNEEG